MNNEPTFAVGDTVYLAEDENPTKAKVVGIHITDDDITYTVDSLDGDHRRVWEDHLLTQTDLFEFRVQQQQYDEIVDRFGKEDAECANYGWGIEEGVICTKVYGHGVMTTWFDPTTGEITDSVFEARVRGENE